MRVLFVVTAFQRYENDVITPWLLETIKKLEDLGIAVTVFAPSYRGLADHTIQGIPVRRFRYFFRRWENLTHEETTPDRLKRGIFYKMLVIFYLIGGAVGIVRLCAHERFDVIHVHWPFPHALFGYLGRRVCGAKLVCTFYGVELQWVLNKMPVLRPFLQWAARVSDEVIAISSYTAAMLRSIEDGPVRVIPYGISIGSLARPVAPPAGEAMILFVGRLVERKGVAYLIDAIEIVRRSRDVRLVVIGEGPERGLLEERARQRGIERSVEFAGKVEANELAGWYDRSDIFVLPAVHDSKGDTEGLGVVLLEALSYGKAVVASRVGGIVDIVEHEKTGLLVEEKDAEQLAGAIERLLADGDLYVRLVQGGQKRLTERFRIEAVARQLSLAYT
jgi:glycosyltransferase involved in cell wall biosynthesis